VGYAVDTKKLRQDFPEVPWQSFEEWASQQDWSAIK